MKLKIDKLYEFILLFIIAAFLGDIIEMIFCRITDGVWMSRSSVVWGDFSIVWGLGAAGLTLFMQKYSRRSPAFIFIAGTMLGGIYEYACSVFTELVFGAVFWDYSHIPLNFNGRINFLFCLFWGVAAVVWIKLIYPVILKIFEKLPARAGKTLAWIFALFMLADIVISSMALLRCSQRSHGIAPQNALQAAIDESFGDERMKKIYPNAIMVD